MMVIWSAGFWWDSGLCEHGTDMCIQQARHTASCGV